jgi:hypothetical protein
MTPALRFFCNSLAGLAGRIMLYCYQSYVSVFTRRSNYADMLGRLPVKREIILLKSRQKEAAAFNQN